MEIEGGKSRKKKKERGIIEIWKLKVKRRKDEEKNVRGSR